MSWYEEIHQDIGNHQRAGIVCLRRRAHAQTATG